MSYSDKKIFDVEVLRKDNIVTKIDKYAEYKVKRKKNNLQNKLYKRVINPITKELRSYTAVRINCS